MKGLADPAATPPPSPPDPVGVFLVPSLLSTVAAKLRPKPPGDNRRRWLASARAEQLPPAGVWWFVWFILAGRGWGKTRTGAEHVAHFARTNPGSRIAVIGRTDNEARRILLNGTSGLKSVFEDGDVATKLGKPWIVETPGDTQVHFSNGTIIYVVGASSPDALRGLNLDMAWCDELAAWRHQQVIWDEILMPAVRVGPHPHILVTTTPKPTRLVRALLKDDTTAVVRGSTFDNVANLAASFIRQMRRKYEGTRAGRQELYAEILDDVPGALVSRATLDAGRVEQLPRTAVQEWDDECPERALRELVIALDPSDAKAEGDEAAVAVVGLGWDHELYVVETSGSRDGVLDYLRDAVRLTRKLSGTLVIEKNHGGGYLVATLQQIMREEDMIVPYRIVVAADGKRTRAEPVAVLFGNAVTPAQLHMVGEQVDVEDQLTSWTGAPGEKSPDRLDALVWAATYFLQHTLAPESDEGDDDYSMGTGSVADWANDGQDYSYA